MEAFVLDASVSLGWLIDNPPSPYAVRIRQLMVNGGRPIVPVHWILEVANALLTAYRRKLLHRPLAEILADVDALVPFVEIDDFPDTLGTVVGVGQRHNLTSYDAAYVALAARRNLPLATQDRAMISAARALKISVVR